MTLFAEQVRLLEDESMEVSSSTNYNVTVDQDWTTEKSESITLSKTSFVVCKMKVSTSAGYGAGRITVDGTPVITTGEVGPTEGVERIVVMLLAAGSYTIAFQIAMYYDDAAAVVYLDEHYVGIFNFPDKVGAAYDSGSTNINNGASATLIDQTVTFPTSRKLPFGVTKECCVLVQAICQVDGRRSSEMQDNEATPTAGFSGFRVYVDNVQVDWGDSKDDQEDNSDNLAYGEGAYGLLNRNFLLSGTNFNLKIKAENNIGSNQNHRVYVRMIGCVWFIGGYSEVHGAGFCEPFDLSTLPFQSTLYVTAEPVWQDESKTLYVGKQRCITFGAGSDYYVTQSGTGIQQLEHTFEKSDPSGVLFLTYASTVTKHGMAITMIGADMR